MDQPVTTLEQIISRREYSDFQTLAKALGLGSDAAKMRFRRKDEQARQILAEIILAREAVIAKYNPKFQIYQNGTEQANS